LPVEVEIYIEADGSVVFADLAADVAPLAQELNPDQPLACEPSQQPAGSSASGSHVAGEEHEQDDGQTE
jgi:hypothetical protein